MMPLVVQSTLNQVNWGRLKFFQKMNWNVEARVQSDRLWHSNRCYVTIRYDTALARLWGLLRSNRHSNRCLTGKLNTKWWITQSNHTGDWSVWQIRRAQYLSRPVTLGNGLDRELLAVGDLGWLRSERNDLWHTEDAVILLWMCKLTRTTAFKGMTRFQ